MTDQNTALNEQQVAQQTVQIGFEKALVMMNPEWRTVFTPDQVNQFRHFYHQALQDMNLLNQISFQSAQQNFQAVLHTVVVTGNEEQLAELQRQQEAAMAAEAKQPQKKAKTAPAKKATPVAKATATKAAKTKATATKRPATPRKR